VEAVVVMLACSRNGYICIPSLHQNYTVAEITALLDRISCRVLFAQPGYGADAKETNVFEKARALSTIRALVALHAEEGAAGKLYGADEFPRFNGTPRATPSDANPDKVVYLAFTSGTTGTPKGVMHSDNTLLANGRAMVADWQHDASTIVLTLSPMSHHIGTVALEQTLVAGCELVVRDPSSKMTMLEWIEESNATYVMGVPAHAMDVLAAVRKAGRKRLGNVKVFYMAGAPIPQQTAEQFLAIGVTPQNVYGMTENGSHQYTLPTDDVSTITKTCGKSCKGYQIKLWDPANTDQEVGPGDVGEIGGRGAVLTLGYFANQGATESSFNKGGWFLSGDLGQFDANGNLVIVGRKKDLIIRGGHNIHPAHIEALAVRHKGAKMVAAFGVADERLGEKVCLATVPDGDDLTAADMLEHLSQQGLSRFDMPEYFISVNEFPMTASGKILKRELVEWVKAGRIKPRAVRWRPKKGDA
jgi:acyl-CoA synthetase